MSKVRFADNAKVTQRQRQAYACQLISLGGKFPNWHRLFECCGLWERRMRPNPKDDVDFQALLVNAARGLTKSYGERLRGCNARGMNPKAARI